MIDQHYPVSLEQEVIWGDMDAYEHVNNTVYFRYFEDARMAFFGQAGVVEHKASTGIGPILASTQCDFRAPLSHPERIRIVSWIDEIKPKRFTMHYRVFSLTQQRLAAEGTGLVVFYDYGLGKSCEIPAPILARIQALQAGFSAT
ncbi:acyl-CoA thioesterase [Atopomonas sediminilitoris]|uniref:acyl-CoA thioesterase n=1 Tax=Atopomonas sediminilitoris TaxID=2919919 RepID=UPI001F4DA9A4|nr:thioesterase family protein [Atopomonas sediminilitoris]MCJ8168151.1 acyl-CoA thioesterase [Atopomonas sediminilitoris]